MLLKQLKTKIAEITTSKDGAFFFQIMPGNYNINIKQPKFKERNEKFTVDAFETVTKNYRIEPSGSSSGPEPMITETPTETLTPTPTPEPVISSTECAQGGVPARIKIMPRSVVMSSGGAKKVMVQVLKEDGSGCAIKVNANCVNGCWKIKEIVGKVSTNNRGLCSVLLKTKKLAKGFAKMSISAGDIELEAPVFIKRLTLE